MPSVETPFSQADAPAVRWRRLDAVLARVPVPAATWRIARFLGVGTLGLLVDAAVFSLLYGRGSHAAMARATSLVTATIVTWLLNRLMTFAPSGRPAVQEALRYAGVALLAQGFNYVSFLVLLHLTGATHPLRTLFATAVLTAGFSFTGQSLFAFRPAGGTRHSVKR